MIKFNIFEMYNLKEMSLSAELFLSCSALQLTFFAVGTAYQRNNGFTILNQQTYSIGLLIILLATALILNEDLFMTETFVSTNTIINDYLSFGSKLTICITSAIFILIMQTAPRDELINNNFEYLLLILISILGLLFLCCSNDLLTAYLSIELHSIAFYIMASFKRDSSYSIESGLKYFIIGALSSTLVLFGSALIYGCLGSLRFDDFQIFMALLEILETNPLNMLVFDQSSWIFPVTGQTFNIPLTTTEYPKICLSQSFEDELANFAALQPITPSIFGALNTDAKSIASDLSLNSNLLPLKILASIEIESLTSILLCKSQVELFITGPNSLFNHLSELLSGISTGPLAAAKNSYQIENTNMIFLGLLLISAGLFIKLALAPFHFWSLDVYEGSPNTTTIFFAVMPKIALFVLFVRLCHISFQQVFTQDLQSYFILLAVLSVFVGSLGGLEQRKLKTLLAYSSISHTGYLFLAFSMHNTESIFMILYYLAIFMISGLCFWSVYLFTKQNSRGYANKHNKELGDFLLLNKSNPALALIMSITLFSLAGIPPLVGFLAKIFLFTVVVGSSAYLVGVASILLSLSSTLYYIRLVKVLYFENSMAGKLYLPIKTKKSLIVAILGILLVALCVNPTLIYLTFYKGTLILS